MSVFVRILPFIEGQSTFNAGNFAFSLESSANATVASVGMSFLWCPSDATVSSPSTPIDSSYNLPSSNTLQQYYTSYGGNQGLWDLDIQYNDDARYGYAGAYAARKANMNGVIFMSSNVRLAEITDGTSNTMLFAEHCHGRIAASLTPTYYQWWNSSYYTDTLICTYYPLNSDYKSVLYNTGARRVLPDRRQLSPRWRQRRVLRRFGEVHQGLDPVAPLQPVDGEQRLLHLQQQHGHLVARTRHAARRLAETLDP